MRWFKHLVNSWDDEKIASIVSEHGLEIYGFWWRILEIIGKQMDASPKTFCQYSVKTWAKFAGVSAIKFMKFADKLEEKKLIILKNHGNELMIDVPNMVKFRDEWTKRQSKNS
jgi:hypothetical protein